MENKKFDLFFTLLRLKSYLVSLLDSPDDSPEELVYTAEFLERKFPSVKDDVLKLLQDNDIFTDATIAFDETIHIKFKEIVEAKFNSFELGKILDELSIKSESSGSRSVKIEIWQKERSEKLNKILGLLYQLAKNWIIHKDLENKIDDYSILENEELLRPEEEKKLLEFGTSGAASFEIISEQSKKYIELLIDYYFNYGGDIPLNDFVLYLEKVRNMLDNRYKALFKKYGLDMDNT
ncbi:MAG: hypothetical protein GXX85_01595 [Ignavibacteria bacterium]|nr:hypothetical protein [Ignavibacteria bacterium]